MKLEDIFEDGEMDGTRGGGFPEKKVKDKTKLISKLLRRKADRSNPKSSDNKNPSPNTNKSSGDDPDHYLGQGLQ